MTLHTFVALPSDAMIESYAPAGGGVGDVYLNHPSICHAKALARLAGWTDNAVTLPNGHVTSDVNIIVAISCRESLDYMGDGRYPSYYIASPAPDINYGVLQINTVHVPGSISFNDAMSGASSATSGPGVVGSINAPWIFGHSLFNSSGGVGNINRFNPWGPWTHNCSNVFVGSGNGCFMTGIGSTGATYLTEVENTSCIGSNYGSVANGTSPAVLAMLPTYDGFDAVGQALAPDGFYYVYEAFHAFDTSSIGSSATIDSNGTYMYIVPSSDGSASDFTLEAHAYTWPGSVPMASDWRNSAQLALSTLLGSWNTNGGVPVGSQVPLANNGFNDSTINKVGLTKIVTSTSKQRTQTAPTGSESVSYYFGDTPGLAPGLVVNYAVANTPPYYTGLPTPVYQFSRIGPAAPTATVNWVAHDAEQTGATQLQYKVNRISDNLQMASGTFTSDVIGSVVITYNMAGMVNGDNSLRLGISDGIAPYNTADFIIRREDESPFISTPTTSPTTVVSANYSIIFTPADVRSTQVGELTYWIYTGAGATGTQLAVGTCSSGNQVSAGVVDPGYSGATRYIRVRNGAGNITETSLSISANTPPVFSVQPTPSYGSMSATGPFQTFTVGFTATDAQQTGANQLTYRVFRNDNAVIVGPIAFTSGAAQTTSAIPYSIVSAEGSNTGWYVTVTDGTTTITSNVFTVRRDSGAPTLSAVGQVSPPATSTIYSISFITFDAISVGANELQVSVWTGAGGSGTQVGATTVTSSGAAQVIGVSDGTVANGVTRYLRVRDVAGNSSEVALTIVYNTPPSFSAQPTISYGSGLTRNGPRNASVSISFTSTDTQSGTLTWTVIKQSNGLIVGGMSGTCQSGVLQNVQFPYNAPNMDAGNTTLQIRLQDTYSTLNSNPITVLIDTISPFLSGTLTSSPTTPTSASQAYTLSFTPSDATSTNALELRYQINSSSTAGTGPGAGNLLGGAGGTSCSSGTPITTPSITTDTFINGINTRYVRVRDGAGNWAEAGISIQAILATPASFTVQTTGGTSTTTLSPLAAGKVLGGSIVGTSAVSLALGSAIFIQSSAGGTSSLGGSLSAAFIIRFMAADGVTGISLLLTNPAVLSAGISGASSTSTHLTANVQLAMSIGGVSTTSANLDATRQPAYLTPSAGGTSSTSSVVSAHIVPYIVSSVAGSSSTSLSLVVIAVANLTLAPIAGTSTTPTNLRWVGGINIDFDALAGTSSTSLGMGTATVPLPSVVGTSSTSLTLLSGLVGSFPPEIIEALASFQSLSAVDIEILKGIETNNVISLETYVPRETNRAVVLETRAQVGPPAIVGVEILLNVLRSLAESLESLSGISSDDNKLLRVESLGSVAKEVEMVLEISANVASAGVPLDLESLIPVTATLTCPIESLVIHIHEDIIVPIEILINPTVPQVLPIELTSTTGNTSATMPLETLVDAYLEAVIKIEGLSGKNSAAIIPVEAEGYVMDITPDIFFKLYIPKRNKASSTPLYPPRPGITVKTFQY